MFFSKTNGRNVCVHWSLIQYINQPMRSMKNGFTSDLNGSQKGILILLSVPNSIWFFPSHAMELWRPISHKALLKVYTLIRHCGELSKGKETVLEIRVIFRELSVRVSVYVSIIWMSIERGFEYFFEDCIQCATGERFTRKNSFLFPNFSLQFVYK